MKFFFVLILIVGFGVGLCFAVIWLIKWHKTESLSSANRKLEFLPYDENLLGKFDYTGDEWKYAYQMEFTNFLAGKSFLRPSSVEIYENTENYDRDSIPGTIYFLPDQIIIINGLCSKTYRFNNLNFAGYGTKVLWANLSDTSFMKTLEMKTKIITGEGDYFEDYSILIPSSANAEIERFSKIYNHNS